MEGRRRGERIKMHHKAPTLTAQYCTVHYTLYMAHTVLDYTIYRISSNSSRAVY